MVVDKTTVAIGTAITSLIGSAYVIFKHRRIEKDWDDRVNRMSKGIDIDVPEEMIERATNIAVENAIEQKSRSAVNTAVNAIRSQIDIRVREAVDKEFKHVKDDVKRKLIDKIGNLDISSVRKEAIEEAKDAAKEKFEDDLDDILDEYKDNLKTVAKIYKSMAKLVEED